MEQVVENKWSWMMMTMMLTLLLHLALKLLEKHSGKLPAKHQCDLKPAAKAKAAHTQL